MICRRCGMESSTTDRCEWCKKPMLPPGGRISTKAKEELIRERADAAKRPDRQQADAAEGRETEEEAAIRRPESKPPSARTGALPSGLMALGGDSEADAEPEGEGQVPNYLAGGETANAEILRPLGALGSSVRPEEEARDTTLYIGNDENILRPIERPTSKDAARYTIDAAGRKRRMADDTPEVPEKTRLLRGAAQGAVVSMVIAIVQFVVNHEMPMAFVVIPITDYKSFVGAFVYGLLAAIFYGFMLAALLVQRRWGPVAGFLIGAFMLGWLAQLNSPNPPWSMINGAICGILTGRSSVKGLRRVVTV